MGPSSFSETKGNTHGMAEFIYTMRKVRKAHGDKVILDDVTLNFLPGAKIGVVGPNGAGKSSVLRIMAGLDNPNNGDAFMAPGASVGILMQEPQLDEDKTVRENVEEGVPIKAKLESVQRGRRADGHRLLRRADGGDGSAAGGAGRGRRLGPRLEARAGDGRAALPAARRARHPPVRWREASRRAVQAAALRSPTCCCSTSPPTTWTPRACCGWSRHLADYKGAILAVTHDRYFLDNVAEWILELDRGRAYPYEGNYSTYLEKKAERLDLAGPQGPETAEAPGGGAGLGALRRQGPAGQEQGPARSVRGDGGRGGEDPQTRLRGDPDPDGPTTGQPGRGRRPTSTRASTAAILIKDLSFTLPRNGIVGVIGPNGVGKTTLFKTIVGLEEPDSGIVKVGETVKLSYVDQNRGGIDPKKNVWEVVSDGLDYIEVGQNEVPSRAYVSAFGFKGPDQQKPAGVLSGGERNRLNLALTLKEGGNLILLDEPTNDLDVETLSSLENALEQFPGCAVVISHDRWFLDRTCTHILAWEGDDDNEAKWFWFEGNFGGYEENKLRAARRRCGTSAQGHAPPPDAGLIRQGRSAGTGRATNVAPACQRRHAGL